MQHVFAIQTRGPACHDFTAEVTGWLRGIGAVDGVVTLFVRHTSCSLLVQENADPDVQRDLLAWLDRIAPPADHPAMHYLTHRAEGPDDMPAHLKAAILPVSLQIPVAHGRMELGSWQGIYLVEHRARPHRREVAAHFQAA
ncbi:secondary thiamine-phosphate synthase enzyme YjbQ [Paracoccus sp. PS-1]|uniref:secondary thiamine-phosphate synthase enzyme YjbQ n=1 Tax=unclassified Paracoccus (in: a-proteobacteria) TaxID=2688777 RepID=UPI00048B2C53|nr:MULTISPECIES: secondary thiamine-phosphate synthase enzyme YjbQ [unclassified Paracoccus (in: a-proteobacteria)]MDQ7262739.1 secondary thiamine-phosphate synthase enzyme YjbQ [Paracoccus sp. PS1]RQP04819.1 MAG: YjbQ family protein [Paracoccus sp. BP8]